MSSSSFYDYFSFPLKPQLSSNDVYQCCFVDREAQLNKKQEQAQEFIIETAKQNIEYYQTFTSVIEKILLEGVLEKQEDPLLIDHSLTEEQLTLELGKYMSKGLVSEKDRYCKEHLPKPDQLEWYRLLINQVRVQNSVQNFGKEKILKESILPFFRHYTNAVSLSAEVARAKILLDRCKIPKEQVTTLIDKLNKDVNKGDLQTKVDGLLSGLSQVPASLLQMNEISNQPK